MIRDAVLFDMGYTLLAPYPTFEDLVVRTLARCGFETTAAPIRAAEPTAWRRANARVVDPRFTLSREQSAEFWLDFYDILLTESGVLPTPDRRVSETLFDTFSARHNYAFYDDVRPVLQQLRAEGVRLGVVSNWEGWLHDLLADHDIAREFECVIVSGTVGLEKPDPAIFDLAFQALGLPPQQCTYVGDSLEHDVTPSLELGVAPVLIDRRGRLDETAALPCRRITTLYELLDAPRGRRSVL